MNDNLLLKKIDNIERMLSEQNVLQKDVLNLTEACTLLDLSASNVYKLTSTKSIPHYCPNGKKLYFDRTELTEWLKSTPITNLLKNEKL